MMPESVGITGWVGGEKAETRTKQTCRNLEPSFGPSCFTSQFPQPWKLRRSLRSEKA